jgi:hypothetical protein
MRRKAVTKRRVYRRKRPRRRPVAGLLEPRQALVLAIDPPLRDNEQPVALTPNAGDIMLRDAAPDRVTIVNTTDRIVAYLMTVAPKLLIKAATVPWQRVITDLSQAVRNSGVLDRFAQLLNGGK